MKFNNQDIYTGHIMRFEVQEIEGKKVELATKIEFRGEYELFIKVNDVYVPVRDITGLIRFRIIQKLSEGEIKWSDLNYKNLDRMLVPYNYKGDHGKFLEVMTANGGRFVSNLKQVHIIIQGEKTLEELMDLRNKYKYKAKPIREDQFLQQQIDSDKFWNMR